MSASWWRNNWATRLPSNLLKWLWADPLSIYTYIFPYRLIMSGTTQHSNAHSWILPPPCISKFCCAWIGIFGWIWGLWPIFPWLVFKNHWWISISSLKPTFLQPRFPSLNIILRWNILENGAKGKSQVFLWQGTHLSIPHTLVKVPSTSSQPAQLAFASASPSFLQPPRFSSSVPPSPSLWH